jgi:hypothetical protein
VEVRRVAALIVATMLLAQTRRPGVRVSTAIAGLRSPVGALVRLRWPFFQLLLSWCCLPVVVVGRFVTEFFGVHVLSLGLAGAERAMTQGASRRLGRRCLPVADGWFGLIEGLMAWALFASIRGARDGCCVGRRQRSSRPYMAEAASHTTAMRRNAIPTGSTSSNNMRSWRFRSFRTYA